MKIPLLTTSISFILLALLCLLAPTAHAATWYVATNGVDTNPGTQASPFKTIQHGIDNAADGDTINVGAGTYYEGVSGYLLWDDKSLTLQGAGAGLSIIDRTFVDLSQVPSTARIDGFTIQNSSRSGRNGGGIQNFYSSPTVSNCAFKNNRVYPNYSLPNDPGGKGGAMYNHASSPTVINCTFSDNSADLGGGAMHNDQSSPLVMNCTFNNNKAQFFNGGGMFNYYGSPRVISCTFSNNNTPQWNGGAMFNNGWSATPIVTHCTFVGNSAGAGAGIYNANGWNATVADCTFLSNVASSRGGAIYNGADWNLTVVNCTFANNSAVNGGGAIYNTGNPPTIANCILWGNTGGEILTGGSSLSTVSYSDVKGGYPGTGNIDLDPRFSSNYHLQSISPCINAGSELAPGLPATDADGSPRVQGSAPDMGAFEFWSTAFGAWCVDGALGKDVNAGSPAAPFKTVNKALNVAKIGESIFIKPGNYGSDRPRISRDVHLRFWGDAGLARIGQP